jgi:hypothetical protein
VKTAEADAHETRAGVKQESAQKLFGSHGQSRFVLVRGLSTGM